MTNKEFFIKNWQDEARVTAKAFRALPDDKSKLNYKHHPKLRSPWEIVNHIISWRETVLKRINGENIESPDDNYFSFIRDRSENSWQKTKERFRESQIKWLKTIKKFKSRDLDAKHDFSTFSNYELVLGILQHDAYHLGQIRLMKKLVQLT